MSTIACIINSKEYKHHQMTANMIRQFFQDQNVSVVLLDLSRFTHNEFVKQIKKLSPDVVITLDLAGFVCRTQTGECFLNTLYSKNLNLVWGDKPEYAPMLSKKLSLSMVFYDLSDSGIHLDQKYPNMAFYRQAAPLSDAASFVPIWDDFARHTLLLLDLA